MTNLRNYSVRILALFFSLLVFACSDTSSTKTIELPATVTPTKSNSELIDELWPETASALLSESLWSARDKYDTAHILMQPMQYAFINNDAEKIQQFDDFFTRYESAFEEGVSESRIATTQYMYFVSQYLLLKSNRDGLEGSSILLAQKLVSWWSEFMQQPAWMWDRDAFENIALRLSWKLNTSSFDLEYYGAIFDEELFLLATMSNLLTVVNNNNIDNTSFAQVSSQALPLLTQMLNQEVDFTDKSDGITNYHWLFQQGIWSYHRDYRYAGHTALADDLPVSEVENIAIDSSHMHRWPLWLASFLNAYPTDEAMRNYISSLQTGLSQQFNDVVYVASSTDFNKPRINNFYDGHNGVYRYNHQTQVDSGFGPYQLSQILYVGWYGNLASPQQFSTDISSMLEGGLSFSEQEIETYVGPNTSRERNPMYTLPDYFNNGLAELNVRISLSLLTQ